MNRLTRQIEFHEGRRLKPYRDSLGFLSIGVGRCLDKRGISADEADFMRDNDIRDSIQQLERACPWVRTLNEVRWRACVDMTYQLGLRGFLNFKRTLAAMQAGDYATAAREMLDSNWARQTPARAQRLATMMLSGEDSRDF